MAPAPRGGQRSPIPTSPPTSLIDLLRLCDSRIRTGILFALARQPLPAATLAALLVCDMPTMSRQLRLLRGAGMVDTQRTRAQWTHSLSLAVRVKRIDRAIIIQLRAADGSRLSMSGGAGGPSPVIVPSRTTSTSDTADRAP